MGRTPVKKLKFTNFFHETVHLSQHFLHLPFSPLSLHTIAVLFIKSDQLTLTRLHLLHNFHNKIQTSLQQLLHILLNDTSFLILHTFPLITQLLQVLVRFFQDRIVTANNRHNDTASDEFNLFLYSRKNNHVT